jgi:hypothetical protein
MHEKTALPGPRSDQRGATSGKPIPRVGRRAAHDQDLMPASRSVPHHAPVPPPQPGRPQVAPWRGVAPRTARLRRQTQAVRLRRQSAPPTAPPNRAQRTATVGPPPTACPWPAWHSIDSARQRLAWGAKGCASPLNGRASLACAHGSILENMNMDLSLKMCDDKQSNASLPVQLGSGAN